MDYRDYQIQDIVFLTKRDQAACFNEQRTGKTPTILGVLKLRKPAKILVVCPASALFVWKDEVTKWLSEFHVSVVQGTTKQKLDAVDNWKQILVISYDTLKATVNRSGFIKIILDNKPECVILDEAHRIRNRKSATALACFRLTKIPIRYALTGTPAPGTIDDIWAILHFLKPEEHHSYWDWIGTWCQTKQCYGPHGKYTDIVGLYPELKPTFAKYLSGIATMRKRKDVMPWLPTKDYMPVKLPLSTKQNKYLKELLQYFETSEGDTDVITKTVLDRLIRYRQICNDPQLIGLAASSPKTDWILQYLNDYPEEYVIVFSNFTQYLKLLSKVIPKSKLIIGDTDVKSRATFIQKFQEGSINVLLINIKAGKEALTLDKADTIIFTDKYPPVGDIDQAEDRFVATTKDRANKQHKIIELMMSDSYDETIYSLLRKRYKEVDIVNNFTKYLKGGE